MCAEISNAEMLNEIDAAAKALAFGYLVVIPTETVYGLGADATNLEAIKRIYQIKNRPPGRPCIVHIESSSDLGFWAMSVPDYAENLITSFWPGPLTLILNKNKNINPDITAGKDTIALRSPSKPLFQSLKIGRAHV